MFFTWSVLRLLTFPLVTMDGSLVSFTDQSLVVYFACVIRCGA